MIVDTKYPAYRWAILAMAWVISIFNNWPRMAFSPLANVLMAELNITLTQYVMLITGPIIVAIFSPVPGGIINDRFGFKVGIALSMIVVGVCCLAVSFAPNYWVLVIVVMIGGLGFGTMFPSLAKLVSVWFPRTEIGLATGIYMTGMSIGTSLALATTIPLFGSDWRKAFLSVGIAISILVVLWFVFAKNRPAGVKLPLRHEISMKTGLKLAVRSRNVWLLGIMTALAIGPLITINSLLPKALADVHHVAPATAGLAASFFTFSRLAGDLTTPRLSDRIGLRRPFFIISALGSATCVYFAWYLALSPATWVLLSLGGILISGVATLVLAIPLELPEVGTYAATASSITTTIAHMGAFVMPTFVIAPIVDRWGFSVAFAVAMAFLGSAALFALPLKETGWRTRHH